MSVMFRLLLKGGEILKLEPYNVRDSVNCVMY